MRQYNTNMTDANYLLYCAAWCCCFDVGDTFMANFAVRAGIVFG
jgi:hypothetical protein